jgi:hypothetical protein
VKLKTSSEQSEKVKFVGNTNKNVQAYYYFLTLWTFVQKFPVRISAMLPDSPTEVYYYYYYYYYYFTAIGSPPGGSRSYTDTDKERLYVKGTVQNKLLTINKVHTVQMQTYKVTQVHVIVFASLHSNKDTVHYFICFHSNSA